MSQYTKSTNFATKDNLPTGDPLKIVKGTEIDTEYNNIATAIATKTDNSAAAITGGTISGITDLAVADGGTGASTAAGALNNLLPSQTSNANKYLQTDGTNATWDAVTLSTADITGVLPVANGGTGLSSLGSGITTFLGTPSSANLASAVTDETGSGALVFANSPTLVTPTLGTPTSATLTNATGLPLSTGITGLGTGVATALAINTPNTGAMVVNGGALGTPSSGVVTNLTGTANININGLVGVTTANNGNFTSINASSTVNLSAGTVDGVLYLDSSKNITTGSVLSFSGVHLTSNRNKDTTYLATDYTTYPNGFVLQNSATPATGIFNSIYFKNNGNMQNVFGVVQNSSGYGDFVWAGLAASHTEWMRLASTGLTLTSNPTLSGGTANGVTYLNGSKVLTSGSALTYNGTSLGVGSSSYGDAGTISLSVGVAGTTSGGLQLWATSAQEHYIQWGDSTSGSATYAGAISYSHASDFMRFWVNSTEQLRLTSSSLYTASGINLIIGGTSVIDSSKVQFYGAKTISDGIPQQQLNIADTSAIATGAGGAISFSALFSGSSYTTMGSIEGVRENGTSGNYAGALVLKTRANGGNNNEVARFTSAGNLGLGVTPSAWNSVIKSIEIGQVGNGISGQAGSQTSVSCNAYFGASSWLYSISGRPASAYQQTQGQHIWLTSTSTQTVGTDPVFSQAMTLDASGQLGIGVTSMSYPLDVKLANNQFILARESTSNITNGFRIGGVSNEAKAVFSANSATGEVNLGAINTNYFLTFSTNGANERARIDSSGNLLVGKTSAGAGNVGFEVNQTGISYLSNSATTDATSTNHIYSTGASAFRFYVGMGGTVYATSTTISAISDIRYKENVRDLDVGLDAVMALKPRLYDWKEGKGANIKNARGFIAQEFETVFPDLIDEWKDPAPEGETPYKSVRQDLIPVLVKAIQEQQAMIESLRQRLSAANL
jgi:hypothetical protein